jgi:lycopene cyclase domain-containing protein
MCPPLAALLYLLRRKLSRLTWIGLLGMVVAALVYTSPWDNYLVATKVWFYDPRAVLNIILGYLPLEEYLFIILQTLLVGLFAVWLWRRFYPEDWPSRGAKRKRR